MRSSLCLIVSHLGSQELLDFEHARLQVFQFWLGTACSTNVPQSFALTMLARAESNALRLLLFWRWLTKRLFDLQDRGFQHEVCIARPQKEDT